MPEDFKPVPDPTALTTAQLIRELAALREILETRLEGMDRATSLLALGLADQARDFERRRLAEREYLTSLINNVATVGIERFDQINIRFSERDTRTDETAQQSRISLDAALAAAKEAVAEQNKANALAIGKSELATKERLDALNVLMAASDRSLEDKINANTSRLDRTEGVSNGGQAMWGYVIGGIGLIVALVLLAMRVAGK